MMSFEENHSLWASLQSQYFLCLKEPWHFFVGHYQELCFHTVVNLGHFTFLTGLANIVTEMHGIWGIFTSNTSHFTFLASIIYGKLKWRQFFLLSRSFHNEAILLLVICCTSWSSPLISVIILGFLWCKQDKEFGPLNQSAFPWVHRNNHFILMLLT